MVERLNVLDHRHADDFAVLALLVLTKTRRAETAGPRCVRESARAAPVTAGMRYPPRGLCCCHVRDQDAGGTAIENRLDHRRARFRDPNDAGDVGSARSEDHYVERAGIQWGVFLIEDDEIEAEEPKNLGGMAGRRLYERPDKMRTGHETFAELSK